MALRARSMQPKDAHNCAGLIAHHPIIGPRYGSMIQHLAPSWLRLLGSDGMVARVFEEVDSGPVRILAIGVAVFVTDGFVREVKTPPLCWIGPELARRVAVSDSPVLSDREVREANSTDGLNLIVWEAEPPSPTDIRPEVLHLIASDFVRCLRGFQLKEM